MNMSTGSARNRQHRDPRFSAGVTRRDRRWRQGGHDVPNRRRGYGPGDDAGVGGGRAGERVGPAARRSRPWQCYRRGEAGSDLGGLRATAPRCRSLSPGTRARSASPAADAPRPWQGQPRGLTFRHISHWCLLQLGSHTCCVYSPVLAAYGGYAERTGLGLAAGRRYVPSFSAELA
jgi:hypothetical protein